MMFAGLSIILPTLMYSNHKLSSDGLFGVKFSETIELRAKDAQASTIEQEEAKPGITASVTVSPTPTVNEVKETAPTTEREQVKHIICEVFGDDCDRAKLVALAESGFNPRAKNPHSTATGVFQIIKGTWAQYKCDGERTDARANIECAYKIYDNNGKRFNTTGGWSASYHIHKQD